MDRIVTYPSTSRREQHQQQQIPKRVIPLTILVSLVVFTTVAFFLAQSNRIVDAKTPKLIPIRSKSTFSTTTTLQSSSSSRIIMEWETIDSTYFTSPRLEDGRQIAKDLDYLNAVVKAWKEEENGGIRSHTIETSPLLYKAASVHDDEESKTTFLYGHVLRRVKSNDDDSRRLPVILLFPTAAGPHDVFLYYKADSLLQKLDCLVMICDVVSDGDGWSWDKDKTRYNTERMKLMEEDAKLLRLRVLGSIQALGKNIPNASMQHIAAMGFCLGAQPILEMSRLHQRPKDFTIQALITFHGVFARGTGRLSTMETIVASSTGDDNADKPPMVLICNGDKDPFVSSQDLLDAQTFFRTNGFVVDVINVENGVHGFTNPAQDFNSDPAFGFSPEGSIHTWTKALDLLQSTILS